MNTFGIYEKLLATKVLHFEQRLLAVSSGMKHLILIYHEGQAGEQIIFKGHFYQYKATFPSCIKMVSCMKTFLHHYEVN